MHDIYLFPRVKKHVCVLFIYKLTLTDKQYCFTEIILRDGIKHVNLFLLFITQLRCLFINNCLQHTYTTNFYIYLS